MNDIGSHSNMNRHRRPQANGRSEFLFERGIQGQQAVLDLFNAATGGSEFGGSEVLVRAVAKMHCPAGGEDFGTLPVVDVAKVRERLDAERQDWVLLDVRGADEVVANCEKKLGIRLGESTADGRIFLKQEEECIAACCGAQAMQVNHKYYENLTNDMVDEILDGLD